MEKCKKYLFSENASFILAFTGFVVLISTITLFFVNFGSFTTKIDSDKLDHFGSFIGGLVGAMWSLASFILLYVSLQQQKEDVKLTNEALRLQIEEFRLQQKELEGTKIALEEQGKTQELQRFESTFFNLIELHNSIVENMYVKYSDINYKEDYKGKDCFLHFRRILKKSYEERADEKNLDFFADFYIDTLYPTYQPHLGHYFRNLYQILKFIDSSRIENKVFYSNILRAQLSSYELIILFYNCLSEFGNKKFKPLIEKYHFLAHIDYALLLDYKNKDFFAKTALKDPD